MTLKKQKKIFWASRKKSTWHKREKIKLSSDFDSDTVCQNKMELHA